MRTTAWRLSPSSRNPGHKPNLTAHAAGLQTDETAHAVNCEPNETTHACLTCRVVDSTCTGTEEWRERFNWVESLPLSKECIALHLSHWSSHYDIHKSRMTTHDNARGATQGRLPTLPMNKKTGGIEKNKKDAT